MLTKTHHFLSILIIILTFMMAACQGDPTPVTPEGDPREAAYDFMTALYAGDADRCRALSSREVRDAAEKICQGIDDRSAVASIDLSETIFEVTVQQTAVVTIRMSGRWTILNVGADGEAKEETHASDAEGPIILFMIYEEDRWRFHGFEE